MRILLKAYEGGFSKVIEMPFPPHDGLDIDFPGVSGPDGYDEYYVHIQHGDSPSWNIAKGIYEVYVKVFIDRPWKDGDPPRKGDEVNMKGKELQEGLKIRGWDRMEAGDEDRHQG
jgi:hypothetical protein